MTSNSSGALGAYVERIERLNGEIAALKDDVSDIYTEVKSAGFEVKVVRQLVRERAKPPSDEHLALLESYRAAIGQLSGTPLGLAGQPR